ncbi:MarR family transcriptional regulator [candidate division KSB1 bacterium]|nr:MarR family transcriptional regulator [candidate division KSB1 bacterium]
MNEIRPFNNSQSPTPPKTKRYTTTQGQYLAFIYYYTKIHRIPPAEADIQYYFKVSGPSVHQMIVKLEQLGLIQRVPNTPRSIKLLLTRDELPDLE